MEALMSFLDAQHSEVLTLQEKLRKAIRDCKKRKAAEKRRKKKGGPLAPPWLGLDTGLIFGGDQRIRLDDGGRAQDAIDDLMDEAARGGAGAQGAADQAGTIPGGSRSGG